MTLAVATDFGCMRQAVLSTNSETYGDQTLLRYFTQIYRSPICIWFAVCYLLFLAVVQYCIGVYVDSYLWSLVLNWAFFTCQLKGLLVQGFCAQRWLVEDRYRTALWKTETGFCMNELLICAYSSEIFAFLETIFCFSGVPPWSLQHSCSVMHNRRIRYIALNGNIIVYDSDLWYCDEKHFGDVYFQPYQSALKTLRKAKSKRL